MNIFYSNSSISYGRFLLHIDLMSWNVSMVFLLLFFFTQSSFSSPLHSTIHYLSSASRIFLFHFSIFNWNAIIEASCMYCCYALTAGVFKRTFTNGLERKILLKRKHFLECNWNVISDGENVRTFRFNYITRFSMFLFTLHEHESAHPRQFLYVSSMKTTYS